MRAGEVEECVRRGEKSESLPRSRCHEQGKKDILRAWESSMLVWSTGPGLSVWTNWPGHPAGYTHDALSVITVIGSPSSEEHRGKLGITL